MRLVNGILKWLATLMFTLAAGLLVIILLSNQPEVTPFMLRLAILSAISLVCSVLLRIFFHRGIAFLVILLGIISATFSTLAIDYFYDTTYTLSFLTDDFQWRIPSLQDGAQLAYLLLLSLPVLLLFKKKRVKKQKVVEPKITAPPKPAGPSFSDRIKVATYQINPKNWNIKLPNFGIGSSGKKSSPVSSPPPAKPKVHISNSTKPNGNIPKAKTVTTKKPAGNKLKLPKFGTKPAINDVKLMGDEDHVCPYCLEEVTKDDLRGVAICKECGTWHHQDCWDVTGACGVAHRNKL